ncbi:MAG: 3-isopropylmalate dehydrogenase, partial [Chloroflexi bacterium]|nr:3-isopropylmalate dehydrogenase [Chloroflexota bacterium]
MASRKTYRILVLPGDGIGPEVVAEAVKILTVVERRVGPRFELTWDTVGGAAYEMYGAKNGIRAETIAAA